MADKTKMADTYTKAEYDEMTARFIARVDELEARLKAVESDDDGYDLVPISEKSTLSRYDGLIEGIFLHHEAMSFAHDNGYSASAIQDRVKASAERATTDFRLGLDPDGRCLNLPEFSTDLAIEVIVRILPLS